MATDANATMEEPIKSDGVNSGASPPEGEKKKMEGMEYLHASVVEDLEKEYELLEATPMPSGDEYPVGTLVTIVSPGAKFGEDYMREAVKTEGLDWLPDMARIPEGATGKVLEHLKHPHRDVMIHIVRLDNMKEANTALMHPMGIRPQLWKGQMVYISNPGAKYTPTEGGFMEVLPSITEDQWAAPEEIQPNKTARVVTWIAHPKNDDVTIIILRLEPTRNASEKGKYLLMQGAGICDISKLPIHLRPRKPVKTAPAPPQKRQGEPIAPGDAKAKAVAAPGSSLSKLQPVKAPSKQASKMAAPPASHTVSKGPLPTSLQSRMPYTPPGAK
eukprot:Sspe_Gene.112417::Locus_95412_Transcript_1_1_Confidence_1.000_Length_1053::g.112417::m.112417